MRILFVANPNSAHTRRWVNWFAAQGHSVYVAADTRLKIPWPGVDLFDLPKFFNFSLLRWFVWTLWLIFFIWRWKPHILHAHRVSAAGWLAAASGFHPLVVTPWGSDLYQHPQRSRPAAWLARFVLRRADLITADSLDLLKTAQFFGARAERCALIQWGVNRQFFHPGPASQNIRQQFQISSGPVIFSPRACTPLYNLDQIVEIIPPILQQYPGALFILRDYEADPPYRSQLTERITQLNIQAAVRWVGRIEPWENVAELFRLSDLVISIPTTDGTPGSVLEAMACGVPVIASDLPSLREWITSGQNGYLTPVGSQPALLEATLALLGSPDQQEQFRRASLEVITTRADHQTEMQKMHQLYTNLVKQ